MSGTIVIGGGAVGRLAGWMFPDARVLDWRMPSSDADRHVPRSWGAFYLHEPLEGLPCRSFPVHTTVDGQSATYESVSRYKAKIGKHTEMLENNWIDQFKEHTTGYALETFPHVNIEWGIHVDSIDMRAQTLTWHHAIDPKAIRTIGWDRIVSTIPLYSLLDMLQIPSPTPLVASPICVKQTPVPPDVWPQGTSDVMHVNYDSGSTPIYRTTDRNGVRDYEWLLTKGVGQQMPVPSKIIRPGKIYDAEWTRGMCDALGQRGIHCVGRWASWNSNELTHHSFQKIWSLKQQVQGA